jgi:hypothetical protein
LPPEFFEEFCFGLPLHFDLDPPTAKDKQRTYTDPTTEWLEKAKIKVIEIEDTSREYPPSSFCC